LSRILRIKTNNNFFKIINPSDDYGYFTLNDAKIKKGEPILVSDDNYIFDFFVNTRKDIVNETNIVVNYTIFWRR